MYEVFLCYNPAPIPINFACHTWFVINENGQFFRYEILSRRVNKKKYYLHINTNNLFDGLGIFPRIQKPCWKGKVLGKISGESAKKIIQEIKKTEIDYPYLHSYKLLGPNSNTYTQHILKKFPEWKIHLPWNAFGK